MPKGPVGKASVRGGRGQLLVLGSNPYLLTISCFWRLAVSGDQESACKDGPGPISIRLSFSNRLIQTPHQSLLMLVISTTAVVMTRPGPWMGGQTDLALNVVPQGGRQLNLSLKRDPLGLTDRTYI